MYIYLDTNEENKKKEAVITIPGIVIGVAFVGGLVAVGGFYNLKNKKGNIF